MAFFGVMMELDYDLFKYAFTGVLLCFVVSKLISLAVCSDEAGGGKGSSSGGVEESKLEKRLKVEGLKSLKKKAKKIPGETVFVSEFKGETEPVVVAESLGDLVKADDSFDDRKELGSGEKNLEFLGTEAETCSADQLLSAVEVGGLDSSVIQEKDDCLGVDGQVENEGLISSSEITLNERGVEGVGEEVSCPIEVFVQEINSGIDLEKLTVHGQRTDYKEDDLVGEELERCDFDHKEEVGSVGHGDQELVNDVIPSERREVSEELFEQEEERERSELLELLRRLESLETEMNDQVDDLVKEVRSLVAIVDVLISDEEGRIGERSELEIDDKIDVGFLGGENVVDDQYNHQRIFESLETEPKDSSTQDGYFDEVDDQNRNLESLETEFLDCTQDTQDGCVDNVDDQNEVIRDDERRIDDEGKVEMEISDGEEEWEGIERNELERDFAKALDFVECGNKEGQVSRLGSDVVMQFYGLQKVSMEGPCHELPPMVLKLSARAKWNAWKKLGSMIPEEAMEKYIKLLSEKVPGWTGEHSSVQDKLNSEKDGACSSSDANLSTILTLPLTCIDESKPGEEPVVRADDLIEN